MCNVYFVDSTVVVCKDNADMAVTAINVMIKHAPVFVVGHNVYSFDNVILATSLPKGHRFRSFFKETFHTVHQRGNMGLVMSIPGINNLDTYRYIHKAMTQSFRGFSLKVIAEDLKIEQQKQSTLGFNFTPEWYTRSDTNATKMCVYNIADCEVCLAVCWKLDLFNQIINMCFATNCSINDALVYSTGAIAATALAHHASELGCKFMWTRCDWHPTKFKGGLVWFRGKISCPLVCIIDFAGMYPNIVKCSGISPESVDFVDINAPEACRFSSLETHLSCVQVDSNTVALGIVMYGVRSASNSGCKYICRVGDHCSLLTLTTTTKNDWSIGIHIRMSSVVGRWIHMDSSLKHLSNSMIDISSCGAYIKHESMSHRPVVPVDLYPFAVRMMEHCFQSGTSYDHVWVPSKYRGEPGCVDWIVSPVGTDVITVTDDSIVRHPVGTNIAASVSERLMLKRKAVRSTMVELKRSDPNLHKDTIMVKDQVQWALKIAANSLYGTLSFPSYNTYSPRCGTSVTAIGRWAMTAAVYIVRQLGCIPLYGDTDSVMFIIPLSCVKVVEPRNCTQTIRRVANGNRTRHSLLPGIARSMRTLLKPGTRRPRQTVLELLCGSNVQDHFCQSSMGHVTCFKGIVLKVVNKVLSYTHLSTLKVEVQPPRDSAHSTHRYFLSLSAKHYIATDNNDNLLSKGVSYVRRVGTVLANQVTRSVSAVIMSDAAPSLKMHRAGLIYQSIKEQITNGSKPVLYAVTQTVNGVTQDVVRVVDRDSRKVRFVPLEDIDNPSFQVCIPYYMDILNRVYNNLWEVFRGESLTMTHDREALYSLGGYSL
jgi:DNA polymerase elongation subunit (family B)